MTEGPKSDGALKSSAWVIGSIAGVAFALLGGAYEWAVRKLPPPHSEARDALNIAAVGYIGTCPILMAQVNGYFADEGVSATITFEVNGRSALAKVLQRNADLATTADIPITYAALNGQPVSVVATMTTMEDHAIVGRRDRGIVTPASLKGKRIGISTGTTTQFFLDTFLNRQKLSPADVTAVNLKPKELAEALAQGEIDAAVLYQPFLNTSAAALGNGAVVFSGDAVYDVLFTLAATRDYVAAHQNTLEKILRATIRGAQSCKESPDAAIHELATVMKTDPGVVKGIWPSYQFEVNLRQGLLLTLEDEARWAIKNKLTAATKMPNFLDHLGLAPLHAVAPLGVTVIH